jgi:hypothetical protein
MSGRWDMSPRTDQQRLIRAKYMREWNKTQKAMMWKKTHRLQLNEYMRNLRKTVHMKERIKQYNQRPYVKLRISKWKKDHPEQRLKDNIKHHAKNGTLFNLSAYKYNWALYAWQKTVKKRDANLCQVSIQPNDQLLINSMTGINSPIPEETIGEISHHILLKSFYPKLSLNVNNGITLSKASHKEVHMFDKFGVSG